MAQHSGTVEELNARINLLENELQHNDESYRTKIQQVEDKIKQDSAGLQSSFDELGKQLKDLEKREIMQNERRNQLENRFRRTRKEQQDSLSRCAEVPNTHQDFKIFKGDIAQAMGELEDTREEIGVITEKARRVNNALNETLEAGQTTRMEIQQQREETEAKIGEKLKSAIQARNSELDRHLQKLREKRESEDKRWHERRRCLVEEEKKQTEKQVWIEEKKKALRSKTAALSDEQVELQRALAAKQEEHEKLLLETDELRRYEEEVEIEKQNLDKKKETVAADEKLSRVDRKSMHAAEEKLVEQIRAYSNQRAPSTTQAELSTPPTLTVFENNGATPDRLIMVPPADQRSPCQGSQALLFTACSIPSEPSQQYSDPPSQAIGVVPSEIQARAQSPAAGQITHIKSENGPLQATEFQNTLRNISPEDADVSSCVAQDNGISSTTSSFLSRVEASTEAPVANHRLDALLPVLPNEATLDGQPLPYQLISPETLCYIPMDLPESTQAHPQSDFRVEPTVPPVNPPFPGLLNAASTFQDICIHNRRLALFYKTKAPHVSLFERPIAFKDTPERDDWQSSDGMMNFATIREFVEHGISNESTTFQPCPTSLRIGLFAIFSIMSTNIKCANIWAAAFRPGLVGKELIIWDCNSNIRSGINDPIDIADLSQHQIFLYKLLRERDNVVNVYIYANGHDKDASSIAATLEWIKSLFKDYKKALPMAAKDMEKSGFRVAVDFQIPHSEQMLPFDLSGNQVPSSDIQQQSIVAAQSQSLHEQVLDQITPVEARMPLSQLYGRQPENSPSHPMNRAPEMLGEAAIGETEDLIRAQDVQEENLDFLALADEEQSFDVSNLSESDDKCSDDDFQPYTDEEDVSEDDYMHEIIPEDMITTVLDEADDQVAIFTQSFISGDECPSSSLHIRVSSSTIIAHLQAIKNDLERRKAAQGWLRYLDDDYNIHPTEDVYAGIHQWFQTALNAPPNPTPKLKKYWKNPATQIIESAISHLKIAWKEDLKFVESFCLSKKQELGLRGWSHIRKFSCEEGNTWTRFVNVVNSSIQRRIARPGLGMGTLPKLTAVDIDPRLHSDLNVETSVTCAKEVYIMKQLCIDEWGIISGWASNVSEAMVTNPVGDVNQFADWDTIVVHTTPPTSKGRFLCEQSRDDSLFSPAGISDTYTDDYESASSRSSSIDPSSPPEHLFQGHDFVEQSSSLQAGVPSRKVKEGADDPYWNLKWCNTKEYLGCRRIERAQKLGHDPLGAQQIEDQKRIEKLEWFGDDDCPIHPNQLVGKGKGLVDGKGLLDRNYFPNLLRICRTLEKAFGTKENAIRWYRNHLEELRKYLGSRFRLKQILINVSKDEEYMRIEREVKSEGNSKNNCSKRSIHLGKAALSRKKKRKEDGHAVTPQPASKKQRPSIWEVPDDPLPSSPLRLQNSVQKRLSSRTKQNSALLKKKQRYRPLRPAGGGQYFEEDETVNKLPSGAVNHLNCDFGRIDEGRPIDSIQNAESNVSLIQAGQTSLPVQQPAEALGSSSAASTNPPECSSTQ